MKSQKYKKYKLEGSRKYKYRINDGLFHNGQFLNLQNGVNNDDFFQENDYFRQNNDFFQENDYHRPHPYLLPNRCSRSAEHQLNNKFKFTSNQLSEKEAENRINELKSFSDECSKFESTALLKIEQNSNKLENLHNRNYKSEAYLPAKFVANYEQYKQDQHCNVCETSADNKTSWRVEKSVELIPAIYLMLPAPDPQAKADALELRKQYGQIQECWESRNRRARQVTGVLKLG